MLPNTPSDNRALTKLDASGNDIFGLTDETGITAWAAALKACPSITMLNLAKNNMNTNDTKILAPAIRDMRALTKFDISSNGLRAEGGKALAAGIKGNQVVTELNISSNQMGHNVNANTDTSGIIAIADAISDMGALTKFGISENSLCVEGTKVLAAALKGNQVMTELNVADNDMDLIPEIRREEMSGIVALADVISGMTALTSLNLSSNYLEAEGAKIVAEAIKVTNCAIAVVLAPFPCPSDHWLNWYCLLLSTGYEGVDVAEYVCQWAEGGRGWQGPGRCYCCQHCSQRA
jgi:Leucine-rich repeat (LRR) protein